MSDRIYHNMPEQPKDDIIDRARELAKDILFGKQVSIFSPNALVSLNYATEQIDAAFHRERDEAADRAKAWYCDMVPEDELDSFGQKALDELLAAILGNPHD